MSIGSVTDAILLFSVTDCDSVVTAVVLSATSMFVAVLDSVIPLVSRGAKSAVTTEVSSTVGITQCAVVTEVVVAMVGDVAVVIAEGVAGMAFSKISMVAATWVAVVARATEPDTVVEEVHVVVEDARFA